MYLLFYLETTVACLINIFMFLWKIPFSLRNPSILVLGNLTTLYTPQKRFATHTLYSYVVKTLRVCHFAKIEEKCMKQYRNLEWECGNKYTKF